MSSPRLALRKKKSAVRRQGQIPGRENHMHGRRGKRGMSNERIRVRKDKYRDLVQDRLGENEASLRLREEVTHFGKRDHSTPSSGRRKR